MQLSQLPPAVSRLDDLKCRKDTKSENLRMQIVEMAVKSSDFDEQGQGQSNMGQAGKENRNPLSKTPLGFHENKKRSIVYPLVQRKKDYINLNFTSVQKDSKDERKQWRVSKAEDGLARVRVRPSTSILHHTNNKIDPINDHTESKVREEYKNQRNGNVEATTPNAAGPRKEQTTRFKSAQIRQTSFPPSLGHVQKSEANQSDERVESSNRQQDTKIRSSKPRREALDKCEIKGNAIPPHPPHQSSVYSLSPRRSGLFSASLAAFKRRLKISSKKFTARLHDDSSTKEEEYIIAVDNANMRAYQEELPRQQLNSISNRPLKSGRVNFNANDARQPLNRNKTPRIPESNETKRREENFGLDQKTSSTSSESSYRGKAPAKDNAYQALTENLPLTSLREKLPIVNSAKTYVLETDQSMMVKSKHPEPIPLTTHNLRLHDSLLSMQARRARRLERSRRMFNNNNNADAITSIRPSDYAVPNERIHRWLQQVADVQESEASESPRIDPSINSDYRIIQPCSAENGFDIHQANKTIIFV